MSTATDEDRPDRRAFAKVLGVSAAVALAPGTHASAAEPATPAGSLFGAIRDQVAPHLTDAQLKLLEQSIARQRLSGQLLHQTKLKNSDEPSFIFQAEL